ncbi:hypothetical protein K438DRAFT_1753894 [Mycena galopus ATCC 62051]|nr:hypothetical protein K438DRAFT_1753894 [Mycena galopus ATCC 62051]
MVCVSACIRERWDQEKTKIEVDNQFATVFAFGSEAPSSSQRDPSRLANFTSVAAGRTVAEKWRNADELCVSHPHLLPPASSVPPASAAVPAPASAHPAPSPRCPRTTPVLVPPLLRVLVLAQGRSKGGSAGRVTPASVQKAGKREEPRRARAPASAGRD